MLKKTDITYSDIRDTLIRKYTSQKEKLNNNNIESYNDYITDEVYGKGAFENEVEAFLHVLPICVALAELNLKDQCFFDNIKEMIGKYKDGYFNDYLADNENKVEIDTDVLNVERYVKKICVKCPYGDME